MDNRPDIWHHLRDHQTPPPPEFLERLRNSILELDGKANDASLKNTKGALARLQHQSTPPPSFLRESITKDIGRPKPNSAQMPRSGGQPRRRLIYGSIAASFLLLVLSGIIYKKGTNGKSNLPAKNGTPQNEAPVVSSGSKTVIDTLKSGDTAGTAMTASAGHLPMAGADSTLSASGAKQDRNWTLHLDGHSIRLLNNDPLFTFTSYHYPEISNYMEQRSGEEIKINVDQFTNIVISKQAASMIREMYQTRSNGNPTRKARKMKDRLENWRRADEKYFDGSAPVNPTDPFELAGFIFK